MPPAEGKDHFLALECRRELQEEAGEHDTVRDVLQWHHTGSMEYRKSKTETRGLFLK